MRLRARHFHSHSLNHFLFLDRFGHFLYQVKIGFKFVKLMYVWMSPSLIYCEKNQIIHVNENISWFHVTDYIFNLHCSLDSSQVDDTDRSAWMDLNVTSNLSYNQFCIKEMNDWFPFTSNNGGLVGCGWKPCCLQEAIKSKPWLVVRVK